MRLGFVGCGKWGQKLGQAFEAEGAELYALARGSDARRRVAPLDGTRHVKHWSELIEDREVDAVVCVAPPDVTTECAIACAKAGKPVMATKPLMLTESVAIRAPFFVDFWRLWSEAFAYGIPKLTEKTEVVFEGHGPIRSFGGLEDYGPHAFAYVRKLLGLTSQTLTTRSVLKLDSSLDGGELYRVESADGRWIVQTGNGAPVGYRAVSCELGKSMVKIIDETSEHMRAFPSFKEDKSKAIRAMCRSFMNDISEGFVTTEWLDLSCAVMRDLAEVRRLADQRVGA